MFDFLNIYDSASSSGVHLIELQTVSYIQIPGFNLLSRITIMDRDHYCMNNECIARDKISSVGINQINILIFSITDNHVL